MTDTLLFVAEQPISGVVYSNAADIRACEPGNQVPRTVLFAKRWVA